MKKVENLEKEFIENQEKYAVHFLNFLLAHCTKKGSKILINYSDYEPDDSPFSGLTLDIKYMDNFHISLKYKKVFFIEVWDGDGLIDFSFAFLKPGLLRLIPVKIRKAMKNLYRIPKNERKRYDLI